MCREHRPWANSGSCTWKVMSTELTLTIQKWDLSTKDSYKKIRLVFRNGPVPQEWMFRFVRNPKSLHGFKRKTDERALSRVSGQITTPGSVSSLSWNSKKLGKYRGNDICLFCSCSSVLIYGHCQRGEQEDCWSEPVSWSLCSQSKLVRRNCIWEKCNTKSVVKCLQDILRLLYCNNFINIIWICNVVQLYFPVCHWYNLTGLHSLFS